MLDRLWQLSYDSAAIDVLRNSKYAIPLIQSVHLFGITLLLAAAVAFNLRQLGWGLLPIPASEVARESWRWSKIGLAMVLVSGFLVFLPDPARYAANMAFRTKMILLLCALCVQFTWYRRAILAQEAASRAAGMLSLALWFAIGGAGRAIAFLG